MLKINTVWTKIYCTFCIPEGMNCRDFWWVNYLQQQWSIVVSVEAYESITCDKVFFNNGPSKFCERHSLYKILLGPWMLCPICHLPLSWIHFPPFCSVSIVKQMLAWFLVLQNYEFKLKNLVAEQFRKFSRFASVLVWHQ